MIACSTYDTNPDCTTNTCLFTRIALQPYIAWRCRIKDLSGIRFVQKAGRGGQGRSQKQAGARGTDRFDHLHQCMYACLFSQPGLCKGCALLSCQTSYLCGFIRIIEVPAGTVVSYLHGHGSWKGISSPSSDAVERGNTVADAGSAESVEELHEDSKKDQEITVSEHPDDEKLKKKQTLADLALPNASVTVAHGGRGGRGNAALRSRPNRYALLSGREGFQCYALALPDKSGLGECMHSPHPLGGADRHHGNLNRGTPVRKRCLNSS